MIVFAGRTSLQAGGTRAGRQLQWQAATTTRRCRSSRRRAATCCPSWAGAAPPCAAPTTAAACSVTGSLPPFGDVRSIPVAEGRYLNWEDEAQTRRVAFLGSDAKKQLFGGAARAGGDDPGGRLPVHGGGRDAPQGAGLELRRPGHLEGLHPLRHRSCRTSPTSRRRTPNSVDRLLVVPRVVGAPRRLQVGDAPGAGPHPRFRSPGQGGGRHLGHGRGGQGLPHHDRRHEVLPGRGRAWPRSSSAASA